LKKILQNPWWAVFLLFSGTFVNALDRGSISTASPFIMKDLGIHSALMGVILSSFFWAYLVLNIPAGILADKVGSKTTLGWSAFIWSIFSALTGLAGQFWQILLFRVGVGVGEAASNPVNAKVVRGAFNSEQRGTAAGFYLSGFRLGFAASPVVMAYLIAIYNWRYAFVITGVGSMLWVALWFLTYHETKATQSTEVVSKKIPWFTLLRHRNVLGIVLCKFFQDYSFYLFVTWLPAYLVMERGFTVVKSGWYSALPWIAAFLFQPLAGKCSDWLVRRGFSLNQSRKGCVIVLQMLAASVVFAGYVHSAVAAVWILAMCLAFESGASVVLWAACTEVAPDKASASVAGIMNTAGALGGILAPIITGLLVTWTGSFQRALLVASCMFVLAALSMWFVVGKVETIRLAGEEGLISEDSVSNAVLKHT
jgi:ACS family glucarate transporter-like MFS transporter